MREEECREGKEERRVYRREGGKMNVEKERREKECTEEKEGRRV